MLQAFGIHWVMPGSAWEALFGHLELGSKVFNVDYVVGTKSSIL